MFLSAIGGTMGSSPQAAPPQPTAACPWERFLDGAINVSSDDEDGNDDDPDNARARVGEPGNVDEVDEPGNVDEEDDEDGHERKRARVGTAADRRAERCTVEAIQADQRKGCTGACGCVARLSLDEIRRNRQQRADERNAGRRQFIRAYLEGNPDPDSEFKFALHTEESSRRTLCAIGFAVYHGFTRGFLYNHRARFLGGDRADDPNLGGNRRGVSAAVSAANAGDAFVDDTPEFMAFKGWFQDLRDDTESMPNSRLRQLDYIEHNELFAECKKDLIDAGTSKDAIGTQVSFHSFCVQRIPLQNDCVMRMCVCAR